MTSLNDSSKTSGEYCVEDANVSGRESAQSEEEFDSKLDDEEKIIDSNISNGFKNHAKAPDHANAQGRTEFSGRNDTSDTETAAE